MSRPLLIAASLAVLGLATPAFSQDKPPKTRPDEPGKSESGKPRIRMGDAPSSKPKAADEPETSKKSEPELLIEALAEWPAADAKQASIRLSAQPRIAYPLLEKKMLEADQDWRVVCGAAATLGRIGDLRALELIEAKLQDRGLFQHSGDLLDALARIDLVGAKRRLIAHLLHPASSVVDEAASRLERRISATDVETLREVYEVGGTTARLRCVELLQAADAESARADLAVALRDKSPRVCFAAATGLAADPSDEALQHLRRAARSPLDRQMAYAYIGLATRSERTGERLLEVADIRALLGGRGLDHLEPLNRAAAAVALGDAGYFHEIDVLESQFEPRVVPALLDAWINPEFWNDMKIVRPLVLRRLRRVTGHFDLRDPREWKSWWTENRVSFTAHRVLARVAPESTGTMVVRIEGDEAPGEETTILGAGSRSLGSALAGELAILVTADEAAHVAGLLNDSGLLAVRDGSTSGRERVTGVHVTVRVGNRERRVDVGPDDLDGTARELLTTVALLRGTHGWQRYRPVAVDAAAFVGSMGELFAVKRTQPERDGALTTLIIDALDPARGEDWMVLALEELTALPDLGSLLDDRHVDRLLTLLGEQSDLNAVSEALLRALVRSRRTEAQPLVLDFITTRPLSNARRRELLTGLFEGATDEDLQAALKNERSEVRVAALSALTTESLGGEPARAAARAMEDDSVAVRAEAVRTLGRLRQEDSRLQLEELARQPGEMRVPAIEALGLLGGKSSLAVIMAAFANDDPRLRVAAIQAFADSGEPEGLSAIVASMGGDPSPLVREVAHSAITRIGSRRAGDALRKMAVDPAQPSGPRARALAAYAALRGKESAADLRRLVRDPSEEVGDEAALALARWRDPGAVERLVAMLEAERSVSEARRALESISLERFGQSDTAMLAALYGGWWELAGDRGPRGWLVDALRNENIEDPILDDWIDGRAAREAVPTLLKGLRSERWAIRRACDLSLRDLLGRKVGDQEAWTTPGDAERMAAAWEKAWAEILGF